MATVTELRIALTVPDFDQAVAFYRDALGLDQIADWSSATRLVAAGAGEVAPPVQTPWGDRNARVQAPDGMQLTLFTAE
jgi:catechol 2,3-dioxygenase-like lactoylglutathione lyase family enzyme